MEWKERREDRLKAVEQQIEELEGKVEESSGADKEGWKLVLQKTKEHRDLIKEHL